MLRIARLASLLIITSCNGSSRPAAPAGEDSPPAPAAAAERARPGRASVVGRAAIGQPAPELELVDLDGKSIRLADFKGKIVVLEWFNPECPFVKASHTKGSLAGTAARHASAGVIWLAINSGAPGRQGHGRELNVSARKAFGLSHPVLLDESGAVGKAYGAKTTPHMFVIDPKGTLVYAGAIDNSPDGTGESPSDGKLVNYVDAAIEALRANKPVAVASSEPYGCSVKYP